MNWLSDNIQKVLGTLSAVCGAVVSYAAAGGLSHVMGPGGMQILGLINVTLGAATFARGMSDTTKVRVSEAMQTAINATPPVKQGGFARISILIGIAIVSVLMLSACATTAGNQMDPTAKLALDTTVRIAVRHAVEGSPRATEKAQHIRAIVAQVQAVTTAESTVAALETVVRAAVDKLQLSPLDRADANDLITLLGVALESRFQGPDADRIVQVNEFLKYVLSALPA